MDDLLNEFFSNNINFIAKQLQAYVDFLFPSSDDNSETEIPNDSIPCILCGQISLSNGSFNWHNVSSYYNVNYCSLSPENALAWAGFTAPPASADLDTIYEYGNPTSIFLKPVVAGTDRIIQYAGSTYQFGNQKHIGGEYGTMISATQSQGQTVIDRNAAVKILFNRTDSSVLGNYDPHLNMLRDGFTFSLQSYTSRASSIYNNLGGDDSYRTTDTINTGDGVIFFGGSDNGLSLGIDGNVSYNDIADAFNLALTNLEENLPAEYDFPDIAFPSYTEIKYKDMGDFYIEPIHQYDKLPTAPHIDSNIDFGEYPAVLAETSTYFLNMLPATLSALLAATLVIAVLIRNLGR